MCTKLEVMDMWQMIGRCCVMVQDEDWWGGGLWETFPLILGVPKSLLTSTKTQPLRISRLIIE